MHFKINYLLAIFLLLIFFAAGVYAVDIMPLAEVQPGMEGIGRTVFQGYEVESFPVQIIDVLKGQGLDDDLILIQAGGAAIESIGGIAAGMSGSPVYVAGRLIGAVSYGWAFSEQNYALVTPIERMLKLLPEPEQKSITYQKEKLNLEKEDQNIKKDDQDTGKDQPEVYPELENNVPGLDQRIALKTPLYISGLQGRALERLKEDLGGYNLEYYPETVPLAKEEIDREIIPGSAVAVQLVRGDVNIASIGTVTYREGNDLLAFGHPFLNRGQVDYLLSAANISSVIPSLEQPFKLGAPTDKLLGSIRVDRGAGIAGKLDLFPRIIPLRININDRDLNRKRQVAVQLIRDENLLTALAVNVALQSLDSTLDRIGRGTARVTYKLTGSGLPDLGIEREDIYYSRSDIAAMALGDFYQLLNMVVSNPFKKINLIDLKLEVEVEEKDQVALVQEARVLNEKILPGDTLRIEVTLHPYRQEALTREIALELPDDMQPGLSTVLIDGGFTGQSYQLPSGEELEAGPETNQAIIEGYKSFQEILDEYLKQPQNNELIVQVLPAYPAAVESPPPSGEAVEGEGDADSGKQGEDGEETLEKHPEQGIDEPEAAAEAETGKGEEKPEIKKSVETEFVLEGNLTLEINIEDPEGSAGSAEGETGAAEGGDKKPESSQKI